MEEIQTRIRERVYDVNLVTKEMPAYEPLLDDSLGGYFCSEGVRKHLANIGLIDQKTGYVFTEREFQRKQLKKNRKVKDREHQRLVELLEIDRQVMVRRLILLLFLLLPSEMCHLTINFI
jgi:hypothetical protein